MPFLEQLQQLGYVEGRSVVFERRFAGGRAERLSEFVTNLAGLHLDVVVVTSDVEALAAQRAMPTTPIVMILAPDPVAAGLVTSLARPGRNVTGVSTLAPELYAKRLEMLKEVIPGLIRVGLRLNPGTAHAFKVAEKRAVLSDHCPYDCRHTFATLALSEENAPITWVSAMLGHANPPPPTVTTPGGCRLATASGGPPAWIARRTA